MKVELELLLEDKPGVLLKTLTPIARNGGNIISVLHEREKRKAGHVPTVIFFEVSAEERIEKIVEELGKGGIKIKLLKSDGKTLLEKTSFFVIFVGHVMDTDARDTISRIMKKGAKVSRFSVKITAKEEPSSALLLIETDKKNKDEVIEELRNIANEKNLLVIKE